MKSARRPSIGAAWEGVAPAKVNLRLRVLAREESGYHQIETVFQALRLSDALRIEVGEGRGVTLHLVGVSEGELGPEEENLVVRAAERFHRALGEHRASGEASSAAAVRIRLTKRIPHGAGLGGGSSDAAAVLTGLNALWGEPFAPSELMAFGSEIGSDVPFFLSGATHASALGRGERILPLPPLPERDVLLVIPPEPISTRWAYETLASSRAARGIPVHRQAENDFEEVLFPLRPELARLKEALVDLGAAPALLSGSGSAVFGVFSNGEALDRAMAELGPAPEGGRLIRTRTLGA